MFRSEKMMQNGKSMQRNEIFRAVSLVFLSQSTFDRDWGTCLDPVSVPFGG